VSIVVRRATREDADTIAGLAMQLIEQHVGYNPVRFSHIGNHEAMAEYYGGLVEEKRASVLVAEDDARLVGFTYIEFEPILYAALAVKVAWLHDIFVLNEARGTGAGHLLIESAASEAKRLGASKMLLSVAAANTNARSFFEHEGFTLTMHEMMLTLEQ
jgi:GNAT superfamily N-acetyltransferase